MNRLAVAAATAALTMATAIASMLVASSAASAGTAATRVIVARPVTSAGHVAPDYRRVDVASDIQCWRNSPSPVAVDRHVMWCAPDAAYAIACWRAAKPGYALCANDPFHRVVDRYKASFSGSWKPAVKHPVPFELTLTNGVQCSIRDGGAAGTSKQHPTWVPWYYCTGKADNTVWASPKSRSGGVDMAPRVWTVQVGTASGTRVHHAGVARAVYLGTKH